LLLSAQWDKSVRLWDVKTGKQIRRFDGHTSLVYCAAFSPDGRQILSGSLDYTVRLWETSSGKELLCMNGHEGQIWCVAFSHNGEHALSGSSDATVPLWELKAGKALGVFKSGNSTNGVALLPVGKHFIAGRSELCVWEIETGNEVRNPAGHRGNTYGFAISKDGRWALTGGDDKTVRLWNLDAGKEVLCLEKHAQGIRSV